MKSLQQVQQQLNAGEFEFSRHAFRRAIERNIAEQEIREAGGHAEAIETYLDDKYSPSALLFGVTVGGRPLHLQVSWAESDFVKIITLYEPEPEEWFENRRRR